MSDITNEYRRIADKVVPQYRHGERSYSCTGTIAKKWQAAYEAAELTFAEAMSTIGGLQHKAAVATIGHDQLNRFIRLFDGAGFRGMHVDKQAEAAVAELKALRAGLPQDVIDLVIAAREFWDASNDSSAESKALDKALEAFAERVPYANQPDEVEP